MLVYSMAAYCVDNNGEYYVFGAGLNSCNQWTEDRKTNDWSGPVQWLLGYLSSTDISYYTKDGNNDAFTAWIDNYCRAHPFQNLQNAADTLALQIALPSTHFE